MPAMQATNEVLDNWDIICRDNGQRLASVALDFQFFLEKNICKKLCPLKVYGNLVDFCIHKFPPFE